MTHFMHRCHNCYKTKDHMNQRRVMRSTVQLHMTYTIRIRITRKQCLINLTFMWLFAHTQNHPQLSQL